MRQTPPLWHQWLPVRVRAMVLADKTLFVAGPLDVVDSEDPTGAFEGRKGMVLRAVSSENSEELSELKLESVPVFDGLIAAQGKLYMSLKNGTVVCLGE